MLLQRAVVLTRRSSALISVSMKSMMPRKYVHSVAISGQIVPNAMTSSLITTNNSALNSNCAGRNNQRVLIASRTMSLKPCFSWEEKRVEVTTPEEFQRRLNRIQVRSRSFTELSLSSALQINEKVSRLYHSILTI